MKQGKVNRGFNLTPCACVYQLRCLSVAALWSWRKRLPCPAVAAPCWLSVRTVTYNGLSMKRYKLFLLYIFLKNTRRRRKQAYHTTAPFYGNVSLLVHHFNKHQTKTSQQLLSNLYCPNLNRYHKTVAMLALAFIMCPKSFPVYYSIPSTLSVQYNSSPHFAK